MSDSELEFVLNTLLPKIKLAMLQEIDELLAGSEKAIYQKDDPSGCFTEYVLDTEAFRSKLCDRIMQLS